VDGPGERGAEHRAADGRLTLDDRGHAHAARGADRNESASTATLLQLLCERRKDPRTGRRERMTHREAAAVDVELRAIDGSQRPVEPEAVAAERLGLPRLERAQHLRRE